MNYFEGIRNARSNRGGAYILPGEHLLELKSVKIIESRRGSTFFCAELTVIESNNAEMRQNPNRTWMVNLDQDSALGNIKGFVAAAYQIDESEVDEDIADSIVTDDQPKGAKLHCSAIDVKTKSGNDFTKCIWS